MKLKINKIQAKSVLTPSKLPGADWVVNSYVGCSFGCKYCYAAFIGRWKHPGKEWGSFVDVKINAPEILKKELLKLERKHGSKNFGSILFSSVTDPYLGIEAKYQITRKCLEVLFGFGYQGEISILTKSPLATRDIDLFKKLNISVGFTVTTLEDKVVRFLEGNAPPASARIKALKQLYEAGIFTYAFIGPLLPHFTVQKEKLEQLFTKLESIGIKEVWLEHIHFTPIVKGRLFKYLEKQAPGLIPEFKKADTQEYRNQLEKIIKSALMGKNLKLGLNEVIYHRKVKQLNK
ncbi:radical SAM protein [Patescibacteria group bacterium]|nr:radical SAM protein [Patescibacteria group bacterium]MBU1931572.1 radical SAM protein [Patescibacteria group bacterium]